MRKRIRLTRRVVAAITMLKKHIADHPLESKTTKELAEYAGLGRNLLQRAFTEMNKMRIKEYYTQQRMEMAKRMLDEGIPIKQVARLCKYRSHSAFTTAFKNRFGIPPLDWLNKRA